MKTNALGILVAATVFGLTVACQQENVSTEAVSAGMGVQNARVDAIPTLPATPFNYAAQVLPAYLTTPQVAGQNNTPPNNQITDHGATLGRVLFYDKSLSLNNTTACASCHQQANAFSDPARFSRGFAGGLTTRNSMSLINARYYPNGRFFWDERSASAEEQASRPIVHPVEMGMTMPSVVTKLRTLNYYPSLFQNAYGTPTIDSAKVVRALAQFIRSMVSYRTKYDTGRAALAANQNPANVNFANFTAEENQGKQLFFGPGNCGACHGTETFTAAGARNNGLDVVSTDNGVGAITGNAAQNALFKVPSLRGIEKSAPYMHDGRFATLEQVVEHYNSQVKPHANLSPQLRGPNGQPRRLNLTQAQKNALVAFMKTLTDRGIASDPKFSNPF
ncbi:MAG: c-type cytochrome [Bacteroidetes bacterium]|nr:c-type cytochrome [Bacteroidota bacterium]